METELSQTAKNLQIQITKLQEANQRLDLMHRDLDKNLKVEETRLERFIEPLTQEKSAIQARLHSKMGSLLQGCSSFLKDYETCTRSDPLTAVTMLRKQAYQDENLFNLRQKETKLEIEESLVIEQAERLNTYVHENRNILRLLENITREIESKLYDLEKTNAQKKLWQNLTGMMKEQNKLICEQEELKQEITDTEQKIQRIIEQHTSDKQLSNMENLSECKRESSGVNEVKYVTGWMSDLPTAFKGRALKSSTSKSRLIKKYADNVKEEFRKIEREEQFHRDEGGMKATKTKSFIPDNQEETSVNFEFLGKLGEKIIHN